MQRTDVIVAGAGPTGLLLAAELALRGVKVTVLDRLREPDPTIKAGSINVASAEILDRRGLLPAAEEIQRRFVEAAGAQASRAVRERLAARRFPVAGHFAGMLFRPDLVDQADPALAAHTAVAGGVLVPQHDLELLLADYCTKLGVEIRRGVEVHGVQQVVDGSPRGGEVRPAAGESLPGVEVLGVRRAVAEGGGVEVLGVRRAVAEGGGVEVDGVRQVVAEGGGAEVRGGRWAVVETSVGDLAADWVVAADGGRSVIRKRLGADFPGTGPQLVGYQAVADLDDAGELRRGWTWTPRGVYAYGPLPGRLLVARFGPQPADRDAIVSAGELQEVVRDVTGVPVTVKGLRGRATRWSDNARQARSYRYDRVLLAGDAAHVHAPFSGQGLNLGLGDAVNLGWKLAATIQGWAPEGLLDTYEAERHPIAARVLDWTRAQVALMRGDEHTGRLREVVADQLLTVPGVMNRLVALTAGILQRYDVPDGAAPVGGIAGDVPLAVGGRIADHAHDGRFVLVDRSPDGRFGGAVREIEQRVAYVPDAATDAPSLLMRPDGVIAWAGTRNPEPLGAAIRRWAGE
jgi:2-polyprenyl-6-methoxyphenol hydroxylase-like FAD-dependent oxidoreductase